MNYVHLFSTFTNHLEALVTQGGYVFLFLITILEGIPVLGMAIPGHITIIMSGFLARIGTLNLCWVLTLAILGAILGDYIGFYLGRHYGIGFIDRLRPYFFITDRHIEKAQELLAKHTGKAMILGRFSPITRPLMPFLVGASKTSEARFWFFNTLGGVSWVVLSVMIGYIFGSGYHAAAGYMGKFVVFAIIVAIIIAWGYRFVNMRFHIFKKYELLVLILNLISLYFLARTIQDAWAPESFMATFDVFVNSTMHDLNLAYNSVTQVANWVTNIGSMLTTITLGILVTIWMAFRKRWRSAAIMFLSISGTLWSLGVLKTFFMRVRPDNAIIAALTDPSFPSGHAAMAAAFFLIVSYLAVRQIKSWFWRELVIVFSVLAVAAIGFSRVVLNVHWLSDVVAGWALGVFLATASILLVRYVSVLFKPKVKE